MRSRRDIRRAGASRRLRVRPRIGRRLRIRALAGGRSRGRSRAGAFLVLLALTLNLVTPLAAYGSLNDDLKDLPPDASPKEACKVLIKHEAIKPAQEKRCRELVADGFDAAKGVSDSSDITIASAAICVPEVFKKEIKAAEVGQCAKKVATALSGLDGGGFDPVGAVGDAVGGITGGIGDLVGGAVNGTIVAGFKAIIDLLFGDLQSAITVALIKWITTIPNLSEGHVGDLEASIAVGAGALLAATMTISIVRFWGAGLTGDGAWAGAEGIARGAVAAVLIGLWPQLFTLAIRVANALQSGILNDAVKAQLKDLFRDLNVVGLVGGSVTGGAFPLFLGIVIAIVGILMLLALVAMKIIITALTIVLFCAMPLAFVVWPIPELSGIAKLCLRSLAMVLSIPIVWCLVFGAFAAIGADTFSPSNTGKDQGLFGTALNVAIVRPLVAISLLYLALVLPKRLMQLAPFTGGGSGFGRALATGATLRAGFHYAPHVARGATGAWKGNAQQQLFSTASPVEKAAAKGTKAFRDAGAAVAGSASAVTGGAKSKLRGQTGQAAKGKGETGKGKEQAGQARPQGDASGKPTGDAAGERRSEASRSGQPGGGAEGTVGTSSEDEAKMKRAGGAFDGPRTENPAERLEAISKRRDAMAADSASGTAVSKAQVESAVGDLQGRADLLGAAKKASFHGNAEESVGAFAEWAETDNPHVSPQHKSAFGVLGSASPSQRRAAMSHLGGGDGGSGSGDGRRVPVRDQSASQQPSPPRTLRQQPGDKGSG